MTTCSIAELIGSQEQTYYFSDVSASRVDATMNKHLTKMPLDGLGESLYIFSPYNPEILLRNYMRVL